MKCSKIAALLLLPVLLCTAGCSVKSGIRSGYEKVISAMGTLTPTPNAALIGVRTPGRDDCTGAYAASCEKARGKDVVFGGCGLQTRRLEITGSVSCQAGFVQILLKNGSKEIRLTPNSSGSIAESTFLFVALLVFFTKSLKQLCSPPPPCVQNGITIFPSNL